MNDDDRHYGTANGQEMTENANRQLSPERQMLHYVGTALVGGGILIFFLTMVYLFFNGHKDMSFDGPPRAVVGFFIGMGMAIVGGVLKGLGRGGLAGSGLVPDPEQARRDLEPWNRSAGGQVADAIKEIPAVKQVLDRVGQPAAPAVVKIRCRECRALADETARFCPQCGKPL